MKKSKSIYVILGLTIGIVISLILIVEARQITKISTDDSFSETEAQLRIDKTEKTKNKSILGHIDRLDSLMFELQKKEGYFVNSTKLNNYISSNVISYGRANPMFYKEVEVIIEEIEEDNIDNNTNDNINDFITDNNINDNINDFINDNIEEEENNNNNSNNNNNNNSGEEDDFTLENGSLMGYDIKSNKLVITDVIDIENQFSNSGRLPVDEKYYNITSEFGIRKDPFEKNTRFHIGLDIANSGINGQRIYSVLDGTVELVANSSGYGNYVVINHGEFKTVYGHMEGFVRNLKQGKEVKAGETIGYVGSTGRSTGPHLHFEVEKNGVKLNPKHFIDLIRKNNN